MSEYQFYEFRAIDRPLSDEERNAVGQISSRTNPSATTAVFVYNYSDFPRDPLQVLADYFDAMLYLANWGSRQLAFRFPRQQIDLEEISAYQLPDHINVFTVGDNVILDIQLHSEDGFGWIEGEGWLSALLPLRAAILRRDYRLLYLAWLKGITLAWELDETEQEPPIPPGLKSFDAALQTFVDLFAIDPHLLSVAVAASRPMQEPDEAALRDAIAQLPQEVRTTLLLRLAQGAVNLAATLRRKLEEDTDLADRFVAPQRTIAELLAAAEERYAAERRRREQRAEAQRRRELEELAEREAEEWRRVDALIQEKQRSAYEKAAERLKKLQELARYQGTEEAFQERIAHIREQYSRRWALNDILDKAGL